MIGSKTGFVGLFKVLHSDHNLKLAFVDGAACIKWGTKTNPTRSCSREAPEMRGLLGLPTEYVKYQSKC